MNPTQHILLTGATGYIGSRLLEKALDAGVAVTALSRIRPKGVNSPLLRWIRWSLSETIPEQAFCQDEGIPKLSAVIHLAHDRDSPELDNINIVETRKMLLHVNEHGISRFVFASSVSSRKDALNRYGRVKYSIEKILSKPGHVSARIGLVYGGPRAGLWATLCRLISLSPIIPMIEATKPNQPIHIDDLCEALLKLASAPSLKKHVYILADPEPIGFGKYLTTIANLTFDRSLLIIPMPFGLVMAVLDAFEKVPGLGPFDRERLLGLAGIQTQDSTTSLDELEINLRPLAIGLSGENPHLLRNILREGAILLRYVTGSRVTIMSLRYYARGIAAYDIQTPASIPFPARYIPALLRFYEPVFRQSKSPTRAKLTIRIRMATQIAEALPEGTRGMYDYQNRPALVRIMRLALIGVTEAVCLPIRFILGGRRN